MINMNNIKITPEKMKRQIEILTIEAKLKDSYISDFSNVLAEYNINSSTIGTLKNFFFFQRNLTHVP